MENLLIDIGFNCMLDGGRDLNYSVMLMIMDATTKEGALACAQTVDLPAKMEITSFLCPLKRK